tara:strand:- start:689 stop:1333 length:645 start_codon:yes stop_codon:yes gene_type:complete
MKTIKLLQAITMLLASFSSMTSFAAIDNRNDNVVFEKIGIVKGQESFTQQIQINKGGDYKLTLTDFAFPDKIDNLGITLTSITETQGIAVIDNINFESDPSQYWFDSSANRFGSNQQRYGLNYGHTSQTHSWGADYRKETTEGYIDAGIYYLTLFAEFDKDWYFTNNIQYGLYGVEMIVTPVPASIVFLFSGLGMIGWLMKKKNNRSDINLKTA